MKSTKLRRRYVATRLRLSPLALPVERTRIVPFSIIDTDGLAVLQLAWPVAGSSSIVYCSLEASSVRHRRGSDVPVFHSWLTGAGLPAVIAGTVVHFDQYAGSRWSWKPYHCRPASAAS